LNVVPLIFTSTGLVPGTHVAAGREEHHDAADSADSVQGLAR
jgi:hypothetical protein